MKSYLESDSKIHLEASQFEYTKKMGSFKPKFEGIPDDFYPLSSCEALGYSTIVVLTIGSVLGIMVGLLYWVTNKGMEQFVAVWSILELIFIAGLIIMFYVGGRTRIREEKRLIVEAQKNQEEMKTKKEKGNK